MAHEIFNEKFFNRDRKPAWHGLGINLEIDIDAREAFRRVGPYHLHMEPLLTDTGIPVQERAVVREPVNPEEQPSILGVVGKDYNLIGPEEVCQIWDTAVERPVETLGVLKEGRILFVTARLPQTQVKTDEIQNYMLLSAHMGDGFANEIMVSSVRTVCMNTLRVARARASELMRVDHRSDARARLHAWLQGVYSRAVSRVEMLNEAYNILANYQVSQWDVEEVLSHTYPVSEKPGGNLPESILKDRLASWEAQSEMALARRKGAQELFNGRGTGMDTVAAKGSAWGLWNGVVELEDYRNRRGDGSSAEDAIFGLRADAKARAFESCLILTGHTLLN